MEDIHGNDDSLGWVRGKFIDHDGERVYRVDEIQSDSAQDARTKITDKQKYISGLEKGDTNIIYGGLDDPRRLSFLRDAKEELVSLQNQLHPLFSSAETILLRAGIMHALENGATKIFLPDGNTVMLSEGHFRTESRTYPATPNNVKFAKAILANELFWSERVSADEAPLFKILAEGRDATSDRFKISERLIEDFGEYW